MLGVYTAPIEMENTFKYSFAMIPFIWNVRALYIIPTVVRKGGEGLLQNKCLVNKGGCRWLNRITSLLSWYLL